MIVELSDYENLFFMCFNETWTDNMSINSFKIDGYGLADHYCRRSKKRGGVAIYLRDDVSFRRIDLTDFCVELDIEVCAVSCDIRGFKVVILNCYRSPDGDVSVFLEKLEQVLDKTYYPNSNMIVCGDFNFDSLCSNCPNFLKFVKLCNILALYGLYRRGGWPTRVTDTSVTCIDHVFSNMEQVVSCVYDNTYSDHRSTLLDFTICTKKSHRINLWRRSYNEESMSKFITGLQAEMWSSVYHNNSCSSAFDSFFNIFQFYFNMHFPLHKSSIETTTKKWVSNDVRSSSRQLRDLFAISQLDQNLRPLYKEAKKTHNKLVRNCKRKYYQGKILSAENTTKACWQTVREMTYSGNLNKNTVLYDSDNGKKVYDPQKIANTFNQFFQNAPVEILKKINSSGVHFSFNFDLQSKFKLCPYTDEELYELLSKKLKNLKSSGFDEIPSFLIKRVLLFIIKPITHLINLSFCCGEFPDRLKLGKVIPILKKGDSQLIENYRPITIPSVFSKIFEYAFLNRLLVHLKDNNIIIGNQHGFQEGKNTMSAVHSFYEELILMVDRGECPAGVFCDLSRAFDCVDHDKLMFILGKYGFVGASYEWSKSFLEKREQYVMIQHTDSWNMVRNFTSQSVGDLCGVPQGSILGPIFFIIYINRVVDIDPGAFFAAFADDVSGLVSGASDVILEKKCNDFLNNVSSWFGDHSLYLNPSKTTVVRFHHAQKVAKDLNVCIGGEPLPHSDNTRFLGLCIDSNLNWKAHCEFLTPKIHSQSYVIRQLKTVLTKRQLVQIYYANVDSRLRYGICFWGWSTLSDEVFLAQKRCIRSIVGVPPTHSCKDLFIDLHILTLPSLYIFEMCLYVFKNSVKFRRNCEIHNIDTRSRNDLHTAVCRSKLAFRSPNNLGPLLFNNLPVHVKMCKGASKFKSELKKFLLEKCFYRVDEYFTIFV